MQLSQKYFCCILSKLTIISQNGQVLTRVYFFQLEIDHVIHEPTANNKLRCRAPKCIQKLWHDIYFPLNFVPFKLWCQNNGVKIYWPAPKGNPKLFHTLMGSYSTKTSPSFLTNEGCVYAIVNLIHDSIICIQIWC